MIKISDLSHVSIVVNDLEAARHFYLGVLGMQEAKRPDSFNFDGAWFRSGSAELHLIQLNHACQQPGDYDSSPSEDVDATRVRHIAFAVENMDDVLQTLAEHNIPITLGPRYRGDGVIQTYCFDPDGHLVELHTLPN